MKLQGNNVLWSAVLIFAHCSSGQFHLQRKLDINNFLSKYFMHVRLVFRRTFFRNFYLHETFVLLSVVEYRLYENLWDIPCTIRIYTVRYN